MKSSLEKLNKLVNFVENIDFERVPEPLDFEAHPRDEIKLISNALNTSLEKLHRQFATLKDFTANASHELKTPLMMISSEIDLALKTKKYKESLMMIKSTTKRLSELLDQLSLITHLESQHTFSKETIFLCEFGNVLVDRLKTSYPDADLQFNCDNESFVTANASLLEIVITNLLENACKYAGKDAQISLIIHKDSLVVQDTGIGIDPAIHDLIFERFWQKEKTENTDHSFGLGLYLVKKIVELHGWNIDLTSEPRK